MNYIIDRLEQYLAVCETQEQTMVTLDRRLLPPDVREGDTVICEDGVYRIDTAAAADRRKKMKEKMAGLFE